MNSKRKGNITEALVIAEFTKREIPVLIPFGDAEPYDMVIDINGKLLKIQVKTARRKEYGLYEFNTTLNGKNKEGYYNWDYNGVIDYFATIVEDKLCLVHVNESTKGSARIRTEMNGENPNKIWIDNFNIDNIINKI